MNKIMQGKVEADARCSLISRSRRLAISEQNRGRSPVKCSHISIDARHGFIRRQMITNAAAQDGARLREGLIDRTNTASSVWADTAYRSKANEDFLAGDGKASQIDR